MGIFGWIIKIALWALAGFLASRIMKTDKVNVLIYIVLGLVGGLIGTLVFSLLGLGSKNFIGDLLISFAGSCLVVFVGREIMKRRG